MSSHVHIGLYDALREAGASEETARAGAVDIPVAQNLATKEDLLQAIAGVNDRIAKVTTDVVSLRVSVFTFGPLILALLVKLVFFPLTLIRSGGAQPWPGLVWGTGRMSQCSVNAASWFP